MLKLFLILSLLASIFPKGLRAQENNKFGIHIMQPSDLKKASQLVNSSGGDWGWVTVVIQDSDMNHDKWQDFMNQCRILHLIPIVRTATHFEKTNWAKPKIDDINSWVDFLNNLNWPTKERWIIIFNEPNHITEWGGEINPAEYGEILNDFIFKLKNKNTDFKILNAGLDLAAPNSKTTRESFLFMNQVNEKVPGIFEKIDGWATHSYPNHGYLGKPWEYSKSSIKGYEWELNYLKNQFGLKKDLPVFITETGWPKTDSKLKIKNSKYYSETITAEYIKYAFENIWLNDSKIVAVTPFVLDYPGELFFDFSWLDKQGNPYPAFEEILKIPKIKGRPEQEFNAEVFSIIAPYFLPTETEFKGRIIIKNSGQSIWGEYSTLVSPAFSKDLVYVSDLILNEGVKVFPGEKISLDFALKSSSISGDFIFGWENLGNFKIKVLPSSVITQTRYNFWEKIVLKVKSFLNQAQK